MYEPDNTLEREKEGEQEGNDHQSMLAEGEYESIPKYEYDENPENGHAASTVLRDNIQDAQDEDPSLEILKEVHNHDILKHSTSWGKNKDPIPKSVPRRVQLKRGSQSRLSETSNNIAEQGGRPLKRLKGDSIAIAEVVVETPQPSPTHEWDVDMNKCLDIFNMHVGEELRARGVDDQIGESST